MPARETSMSSVGRNSVATDGREAVWLELGLHAPKEQSRILRFLNSSAFLSASSLLLLLALWQVTATIMRTPSLVSPVATVRAIIEYRGSLFGHTLVTIQEVLVGFGIAAIVGVAMAILIAFSRVCERLLYPGLVLSQAVPKIALAPLLLIWFGFGIATKVAIATLIAIFPIVIASVVGLRAIDPDMVRLARSMGASPLKTFWKVRVPTALPSVFGGLKLGITLALVGAVVGEFVAGTAGLGYLAQVSAGLMNTRLVFACVFLLATVGICLFSVVQIIERRVLSWQHASESARVDK